MSARAVAARPVVLTLGLALALTALVMTVQSAHGASAQDSPPQPVQGPESPGAREPAPPVAALLDSGRQLYLTSCVSCHGANGEGTPEGPSLRTSGEAKADFYLRTGRMPLSAPVPQPPSKLPVFNDVQIRQLVAYVGSLCDPRAECTPIPELDLERARLETGQELFLANCAPCHNAAAVGGALSYGDNAPSLQHTAPTQVAEAVRTGPGQMPRFGPDVLDDGQVNAIVKYVEYLHEPENPGGLPLGYTGPVAEGFAALLVGLSALLLVARWITREPAAAVHPVPIERTEP